MAVRFIFGRRYSTTEESEGNDALADDEVTSRQRRRSSSPFFSVRTKAKILPDEREQEVRRRLNEREIEAEAEARMYEQLDMMEQHALESRRRQEQDRYLRERLERICRL